VIKILRQHNCF